MNTLLDMEARAHSEQAHALRLWLRLLTCSQLVAEGLVERLAVAGDRRAFRVRLTERGHAVFADMALQHEQWIVEAFEGLLPRELDQLHKLLGKVKLHQLAINARLDTDRIE